MSGVRSAPADARWYAAVQYRWTCAECGESHQCAVIRWRDRPLRLCLSCYRDGFWRE